MNQIFWSMFNANTTTNTSANMQYKCNIVLVEYTCQSPKNFQKPSRTPIKNTHIPLHPFQLPFFLWWIFHSLRCSAVHEGFQSVKCPCAAVQRCCARRGPGQNPRPWQLEFSLWLVYLPPSNVPPSGNKVQ